MSNEKDADFQKVRADIDEIDGKIVELIEQRLKLTGEVGRHKAKLNLPLYVPTREAEIIKNKRALAESKGISADLIEDVIRRIMRESYSSQTVTRADNTLEQDKKILIIGGGGQLGQLFVMLFKQAGYEVDILEKDDWEYADKKLSAASLVMVAVPIRITNKVIAKLTKLNSECVLVDITSLKNEQLQAMLSAHSGPVVGLHPMFGPGIQHLAKQNIVVCHGRQKTSYDWFITQLENWGAKLVYIEAQQHDYLMSIVQVLRHFSTIAYGYHLKEENVELEKVLEVSSPIYRLELIMVGRLFAQNSELYSDIIFSNKNNVPMVKRFINRMQHVAELLEKRNHSEFTELFNDVAEWFGDNANKFLQESNAMLAKANDLKK